MLLWAFELSLEQASLPQHLHSLGFALLAGLVYIPIAVRLEKVARYSAIPLYLIGYGVSVYAVITSAMGRFGFYAENLRWVGAFVPLFVTGVLVYSAYHFNRRLFGWAAVVTLSIAYAQLQSLIDLQPAYQAAARVGLAVGYLLCERALAGVRGQNWLANFAQPLTIGALFFWIFGLGLTLSGTLRLAPPYIFWLVFALVLGLGMSCASSSSLQRFSSRCCFS